MAINTAAYIQAFYANIVGIRATVPPPFGRAENARYRCAGGYGEMRRAGVAANIYRGVFRKFVKAFKRRPGKNDPGVSDL